MLQSLHIENIAVIERSDIEFEKGLNILTGETGAGKSIVIDALDAVLGGRVSRELVRHGAEKALVSAVFTADNTEQWCQENEIEPEEGELVLQRRVNAEGKSTCRVNGAPVTVGQLRELGTLLLNIHGQNDGRQLMDESRHRGYLDGFGVDTQVLTEYKNRYGAWQETRKEIRKLSLDEYEKQRLLDSLGAQLEELEKAQLRDGEEEELESRRELMKNAGRLTEAADSAYEALYAADSSAIAMADEAEGELSRASGWSEDLARAQKLVSDARYMLEDAAEQIRELRESLEFSPAEYDALETRLAQLRKLRKKYGMDVPELLEHMESCRSRLEEIEYADDRLVRLQAEEAQRRQALLKAAAALTAARQQAGKLLEERIVSELRELSMPSVRFKTELLPTEPDSTGADEVRFLMSANAGEEPGRISRIASGGELSRIMLAMKNVFARRDAVPAMVFDEIDTGVSGIAAQRVGEKLARLAGSKQVLCVTHLPQIAAMADVHFVIEKTERGGRTYTSVMPLEPEGQARELARLHGGDHITEKTLASAAEQLAAASAFKTAAAHRE